MHNLLATYYSIDISDEIIIDNQVGYKSEQYLYFTISTTNNKAILMEQSVLAYYLAEMGYEQTAFPIPNISGDWVTAYNDNHYLVLQVAKPQESIAASHGEILACFHQITAMYRYEPQSISSYGQWKQLWIDKLTVYEQQIVEQAKKHPNMYYRELMNVLPYIIGISENAIQYVRESETEQRYDDSDQGTITFQRYKENLIRPVIWTEDLVYDHLTRDLAEYIRVKLLEESDAGLETVKLFMRDYESIRPLSAFSWRLLYARLVFPVHIFDKIEAGFQTEDFEQATLEMRVLLENQGKYEERLRKMFETAQRNYPNLHIPVIQWL